MQQIKIDYPQDIYILYDDKDGFKKHEYYYNNEQIKFNNYVYSCDIIINVIKEGTYTFFENGKVHKGQTTYKLYDINIYNITKEHKKVYFTKQEFNQFIVYVKKSIIL